jgi:hypothetical protein
MGRHIGTFGHIAQVAQVTLVNDLDVIRLVDPVHLHGVGLVYQVEQGRERIAQADAAAAPVANIVDSLQLLVEVFLVPILL